MAAVDHFDRLPEPVKRDVAQRTGTHQPVPQHLRTGMERLTGGDLSGVRVHYNSHKPAQLQAQAYASGNDIYLAPGQERQLAHELAHVVQQQSGAKAAHLHRGPGGDHGHKAPHGDHGHKAPGGSHGGHGDHGHKAPDLHHGGTGSGGGHKAPGGHDHSHKYPGHHHAVDPHSPEHGSHVLGMRAEVVGQAMAAKPPTAGGG